MTERKPITRQLCGRHFSVDVPVKWQPEVDDFVIRSADLGAAELAIAVELALEGPIDSESFRFMRSALGLESRRLAELLAVRPETVSRWENDVTSVDRSAWFTLASLVLDEAGRQVPTRVRLERLASGEQPAAEVRLSV